jgi:excisionase family DNA binding protein
MMLDETYYTIEEAATILKLHPQTLRRWIRQGKLPARRFGKQFRLRPEDFEHVAQPKVAQEESSNFDQLALAAMADLWDNEEDAIYDDWRTLYNVNAATQ